MMQRYVYTFFFICAACVVQTVALRSAWAQISGCRADDADPRRLMVITDPDKPEPKLLRAFERRILESEPSTNGLFVGALVLDPASDPEALRTFTLHVVDPKGKTVVTVDKAQAFKFSPDDRYVAVTVGTPFEGAEGFRPEATRVVDLKTKKGWSIPELKEATEIDWTTLPDEGLTLMAKKPTGEQNVWKYRLKNRVARATKWRGIHFSPDGKYYYLSPHEAIDQGLCQVGQSDDSCLRAYSRTNEEIKLKLKKRFRRALGWTGNNGHELLITDGVGASEEEMEVDLESGRMNVLKERVERRWKTRRGVRMLRERAGRLHMELDQMIERMENRQQRRPKNRRQNK